MKEERKKIGKEKGRKEEKNNIGILENIKQPSVHVIRATELRNRIRQKKFLKLSKLEENYKTLSSSYMNPKIEET